MKRVRTSLVRTLPTTSYQLRAISFDLPIIHPTLEYKLRRLATE